MNCPDLQHQIAAAEALSPDAWPTDLAAHVAGCPDCQRFVEQLRQLEAAWRNLPVPASSASAKQALLRRLEPTLRPASSAVPNKRWRWAAAGFVAASLALSLWLVFPSSEAQASDLLQSLVDWNVAVAEAKVSDRAELVTSHVAQFQAQVRQTALSNEDRELAESLLDNARWMAENNDPLKEADQFDSLADKLHTRLDKAAVKGNAKELKVLAKHYAKIVEKGMRPNLEKSGKKGQSQDHKKRVEILLARDQSRREALNQTLEKTPEPTVQEVRRALGLPHKGKHPKAGKGHPGGN